MEICSCNYPIVKESDNAKREKYCDRCGHWWMPEHGSNPERGPQPQQPYIPFALRPRTVFRPVPESHRQLRKAEQPSRNDPCPCGSGRKFKKCCL